MTDSNSVNDAAFPQLTADQLDRLRSYGEPHDTHAGEVLFAPVEVVRESDDGVDVIAAHGSGRFLGEGASAVRSVPAVLGARQS